MKKIESLPRRAQENVILTLELAIKGVASKAYQTRTASRLCLDFPGITQAANDVVLVLSSIMWRGCRGSAWQCVAVRGRRGAKPGAESFGRLSATRLPVGSCLAAPATVSLGMWQCGDATAIASCGRQAADWRRS